MRRLHRFIQNSVQTELRGDVGFTTQRLAADPTMAGRFRIVYGASPNEKNVADALVAFTNTLVTPNAPFDRWLMGANTLTQQQIRGYARFTALGCASCHQGANVGGNLFQRRGIFHPMAANGPKVLRVPSLRNVAVTAPYFHDGSVASLPETIRKMAYSQLDVAISNRDVEDINEFLNSLTGLYQGRRLKPAASRRR